MKKFIISSLACFAIVIIVFFAWQTSAPPHVAARNIYALYLYENTQIQAAPALPQEQGKQEPMQDESEQNEQNHIRQTTYEIEVLRQIYNNKEIIGNLKIEGTRINYPVTQSTDNNFYLYHDIKKQPHIAGWVFLDQINSTARPDRNTVIYGHNMMDGSRFRDILKFACPEFFAANRYITFDTIYDQQQWEIFAFYQTDISFNYIQIIFSSQSAFGELVAEMKSRSWHDASVEVTASDRILTLSTCSGAGATNYRYVLNARLIQ